MALPNDPSPDPASPWSLDDAASLRRVLEHVRDIVALLDDEHRIVYVSPAVRTLGYEPADCLGRPVLDFVHPDDQGRVRDLLDTAANPSGQVKSVECRVHQRDGTWRAVDASGTSFVDSSGGRRRLFMARDVTDKRALELRLQQAQRTEAVGNLAAGIAHDFNNVLTAIVGWSDSLLQSLPASDPARGYALEIREASQHAADLATHLLALRRQRTVQRTLLNLNDLILRTAPLFRRLLGPRIECVLSLTPRVGLIEADQTQIEQVLLNLTLNARDAMPQGGTLTIETSAIRLGTGELENCEPGPYIRLTVRDSGQGIPADLGSRIFEPFVTTKGEGRGSGLGLAIVKWIAHQHRGGVMVESTPASGATFRVLLPRAEEGEAHAPSLSNEAPGPASRGAGQG